MKNLLFIFGFVLTAATLFAAGLTGISTASSNPSFSSVGLCQGFASTTFPPTGWNVVFTGTNYWTRNAVSSYGVGSGSAKFDFWSASSGTTQSLVTLTFDAANVGDSIRFDHAYCTFITEVDELHIDYSTDAGTSWTELIFLPGGPTVGIGMVTAPPQGTAFTPTSSQWASKVFPLIPTTNKLRFRCISAFGNNLYLDSICVAGVLTGIDPPSNTTPSDYKLYQNYPNPFNPGTVITYQLPVNSYVELRIYDVLGKEIAVPVNERQSSGSYQVEWDASEYPGGVYYYQLTVSSDRSAVNYTETKKMVLVK